MCVWFFGGEGVYFFFYSWHLFCFSFAIATIAATLPLSSSSVYSKQIATAVVGSVLQVANVKAFINWMHCVLH